MENLHEDQIEQFFEKHDEEFLEFDRIPTDQRRHERPDLCAMLLMAERFPIHGHADIVVSAEHDEIWFAGPPNTFDEGWPLSEDDIIYLARCGIRWDGENSSLCAFV